MNNQLIINSSLVQVPGNLEELLRKLKDLPREDQHPKELSDRYIASDKNGYVVTRLDISEIDPDIGNITIYNMGTSGYAEIFRLPQFDILVTDRMAIQGFIRSIISVLNGDQVEYDTFNFNHEAPYPIEFWDSWKIDEFRETYRHRIYPLVIGMIEYVIKEKKTNHVLTIGDIFSGDGEFIQDLNQQISANHPERTIEYHIVDNNSSSLGQAQRRFTSRNGLYQPDNGLSAMKFENIQIHQADLAIGDNPFPFVELPDIVTALGGLNKGVISRSDALSLTKMVYNGMKPGGFFMVSGYTSCLLNAQKFSEVGFNVLNMGVPENIINGWVPKQLYVLQKPK